MVTDRAGPASSAGHGRAILWQTSLVSGSASIGVGRLDQRVRTPRVNLLVGTGGRRLDPLVAAGALPVRIASEAHVRRTRSSRQSKSSSQPKPVDMEEA
jgi:hypothetical protein